MSELSEYFLKLFQRDAGLGWIVVFVLISLFVLAYYRLTYSKRIDNNGKVIVTRKRLPWLEQIITTGSNPAKKHKPFTRAQKRILRIVYSLHEALFGLIIFAVGIGLITKVLMDLINRTPRTFDPMILTCALLGILAIPIGVLLIYFRDADNPFDDS